MRRGLLPASRPLWGQHRPPPILPLDGRPSPPSAAEPTLSANRRERRGPAADTGASPGANARAEEGDEPAGLSPQQARRAGRERVRPPQESPRALEVKPSGLQELRASFKTRRARPWTPHPPRAGSGRPLCGFKPPGGNCSGRPAGAGGLGGGDGLGPGVSTGPALWLRGQLQALTYLGPEFRNRWVWKDHKAD